MSPVNPNDKYVAVCMSKVRRSEEGAKEHAAAFRKRHPGSKAHEYECHVCGYWHVSCNTATAKYMRKSSGTPARARYTKRVRAHEERLRRERDVEQ
ncbi:MAG: hypothetical protein IPK64_20750 [bacterium]|nr:hypothetical protein [bacterium]